MNNYLLIDPIEYQNLKNYIDDFIISIDKLSDLYIKMNNLSSGSPYIIKLKEDFEFYEVSNQSTSIFLSSEKELIDLQKQ
ncbi:hypothetical protein, partial [Acinetobacter stercoris]|uniref:hypothetical protein n=1 Tax=Acinetobacter stercoris TaxID=2126983 RepID=UPI0011B242EA